jgi:hydrogenase nickel incorporation protein HypA/HybF
MHELSLAGSVLQIVEAASARDTFSRVRSLHLSVPALAGVEIDALRFALNSLAPQTVLEGAEVTIDEPPSKARCLDCEATIEITAHDEPCPLCRGYRWQCSSDREIRVVDLLVE